jgi:hypothetical protein
MQKKKAAEKVDFQKLTLTRTGVERLEASPLHQTSEQLRGIDHRRPGMRPAKPRQNGASLHPALRALRASVLLSSNLPFSKWEQIFKDQMATTAAIDRLVHHSVIVELNTTG